MKTLDFAAFAVFLISYISYQIYFFYMSHERKNKLTRESIILEHRKAWVRILKRDKNSILAIQTIRNLEMIHTFFISLNVLLMGGIISLFSVNAEWLSLLESGRYVHFILSHSLAFKLLAILLMLFISFINFIFSLRICFNMNFTTSTVGEELIDESFQVEQVQRQARHFITGIRAIYFTLPLLVWIISTEGMIIYTMISTLFLYRFDFKKIPKSVDKMKTVD